MTKFRIFVFFAALLMPAAALAAPRTFQEFANILVALMSDTSIVLVVLGLVIFFYGISTNILNLHAGKSEAGGKIKAYFFWGVIVLFVMVSVWGILQIIQNTLFGGSNDQLSGYTEDQQLNFEQEQFVQ